MEKIINRKFKRNKIIKKNEKIINNKEKENNMDENEKKNKAPFNYYTPKKQRNNFDKNNYIYYQNESTTAALTGKRERKKIFENKDKKGRDVYAKLQMENV